MELQSHGGELLDGWEIVRVSDFQMWGYGGRTGVALGETGRKALNLEGFGGG